MLEVTEQPNDRDDVELLLVDRDRPADVMPSLVSSPPVMPLRPTVRPVDFSRITSA
jgi:hypothetical protein